MPPESPAGRELQRTVVLLAIAAFLGGAALRLCDGLLIRLASEFHVTAGVAGLVIVTFSVSYAVMQLVFGPLGDRFGKGAVILIAVSGCAVFALAAALAQNFFAVVVARTGWGMAAAGIIPLAMAWIGDIVPLEERQATLAKLLMGTLSGMMFGQLAGGLFADSAAGWRGAFAGMATAYLGVACLVALQVRPHWASHRRTAPAMPVHRQWLAVLESRWSFCVLGSALAEGIFLLGPMAYLPAMLHQRFGVSVLTASSLLGLYAVGGLLYAVNARRLVARLGQERMVAAGGLIMGASYLLLLLSPTIWSIAPIAVVLGLGTYLYHSTLQTHATQLNTSARGTAVSLFAFSLFLGQAIGSALAGWAFDRSGAVMMLLPATVALPTVGFLLSAALRGRMRRQVGQA